MTFLFECRVIYNEKLCKDGKVKVFEDLDTCGKFYFLFLLQPALKLNCLKDALEFYVIFTKLKLNPTI